MTNRTKALERSQVSYQADVLESLLDSCRRNGRPAKFPKPAPKIYFDADRFRWYFNQHRGGKSLQQWRDEIDAAMRADEDASA